MDLPSLNYNTKLFNSELATMQTEQQVRESYRDALVGVRTCGLNLGYGIRREPLRDYSHLKTRPSVRPVVLGQWLIEHGSLVDTVLANYDSLSPGTAKQLMCGTSSGKTTELPVCIANTRGTSVLVLSPMLNITAHVLGYMSGIVAKKHGLSSGVHILTEQVIQKPISDSTVYLCALGEFLASLSKVPSLTQRLSISTIIVDESHFTRPEYEMFKYLVAMNFFPNVIVLYASATAASDISMESTGRRTVSYFPVKSIPEEPENTDASLPFHYSRVTNHTMVFAWSDESVEKWVNYYQNHDIPAIGIGHALRSSHDSVIIDFFKTNATGVLVTTSLHETSFTYDVDMVIDFGRTTEINTDFNTGVTSMVVRNATVSEQVQRAGRVGRFKKGAAYIAKVENTVPRDADDPNICQYIYLWSRVFGININHPPISDFSRIFGSVSPEVVAMMLTSSLPPMALRPYCSMDGMYPAFASAYKVFTPVHSCVVKSRAVECPGIKDWEERSAHHVSLDGGVAIYKSRFAMTGTLKLFQYHLWARSQDIDDIATVRSFALSDSATVRSKHVSFASTRSYKIPDRASIVSTDEYDDTASAWSDTDTTEGSEVEIPKSKIPSVAPPVYSSNAPALPRQLPPKVPVTDRVKTHPVREWSEQVVSSSSSSSSGGSGIDPDMPMKQVDPEKHARDFLYPMNFELRKKYANMYAVNDRDTERVKLCVHGKTDFSKLSSDSSTLREKQTAYFLSFLRVHRSLLVKLMQLRAKPESRGFFHNSSKSDKIAIITDKIRSVAMLLVMCAKLGFTVGIERKGLHSGWSVSESMGTTQQSEVMDAKMEKAHDIATFAVAMAPPAVAENVSHLRSAALPIISESGELIANGWYFNGLAVTAKHVWELMSEHQKVDWCQSDINKVQCVDDTVAVVTETLGKVVPVRPPVNGEHVGLLAAVAPNKKPKMYGYHQVNCVTSPILIEGVYFPGLSGSLLVSYTDGHVVGIYCGFYMNYQGVLWGRVSPAVLSAG